MSDSDNKTSIVISAVDQTREGIDSAKEGLENLRMSAEKLDKAMAFLLPGLGVAAFSEMINASTEAADHLYILSKQTGLTVETINGLNYAAKLSDVSTEAMTKGVQKLSIYMTEAQLKGGQQADMLKALGITAKDPMQALYQLSDAMQSIDDPAQRTYVATQLMGKGGAEMIPVLLEGGDALRGMVEEGQKLNPVSAEFARQSNELHDNLSKLKVAAEGNATIIATGLTPAINDAMAGFTNFGHSTGAAEVTGKALGETLRFVAWLAGGVVMSFKDVGNQLGYLAAEAVALAHGDLEAMKAISAERDKQKQEIEDDFLKFTAKISGVAGETAKATDEMKKQNIDLSQSTDLADKSFTNFIARIRQQTEQFHQSADAGQKLTQTQQMRIEMDKLIETGSLKLSAAQKAQIESLLGLMAVKEQDKIISDQHRAAIEEANKQIDKSQIATAETIKQTEFETSLIGLSAEEVKKRTVAYEADATARKKIADLQADPKFKNEPEELARVTAEVLKQAEAEKKLAEAKRLKDLFIQSESSTPGQAEDTRYKAELASLQAFHNAGLLSDQDFFQREEMAEKVHQDKLVQLVVKGQASREQFQRIGFINELSATATFMQQTIGAASEHSQALFSINKVASLAKAAIALPETVMEAYKWGTTYGGPVLGAAFGALAFSAQAVQMQAIASAEFGGSSGSAATGGGSISSIGIPGQVGDPGTVPATAPPPPGSTTAAAPSRQVNIYLPAGTTPAAMYSADVVRNVIIPAINDAAGDGVTINVQ